MNPALAGVPVVEKTGRIHRRLLSATPARGPEYPMNGILKQGAFFASPRADRSKAIPGLGSTSRASGFPDGPGTALIRALLVKLFWLVSISLLGAGLGSAVRASAVRVRAVETTCRAQKSHLQTVAKPQIGLKEGQPIMTVGSSQKGQELQPISADAARNGDIDLAEGYGTLRVFALDRRGNILETKGNRFGRVLRWNPK